jgi:putative membrane protein
MAVIGRRLLARAEAGDFLDAFTCGFGGMEMKGILLSWIIGTITILIVAYLLPGVRVAGLSSAIIAAAILGILNALVKPILVFFTLPLTILTFGLFLVVVNALVFLLAGSLFRGFKVDSFGSALIASIIVSVVSFVLNRIVF